MIKKTQNTTVNARPSILKRFIIICYDLILCFACLLFVSAIIVTIANGGKEAVTGHARNILTIINLLVIVFYYIGFWRYKQTPAMKIWKVNIISTTDYQKRIKFINLFIRFCVAFFSLGLSFVYGFFNNGNCLHDILSKTELQLVKHSKDSSK